MILSSLSNKIYKQEDEKVLSLVDATGSKVLDYGCGLGRYLRPLKELGINAVGVDVNVNTVEELRKQGFNTLSVEDFSDSYNTYDCIILSHIIEHISPFDLVPLIDSLLDRLESGGAMIIATPLLYDEFYDDYDHLKPYTHKAISILFSDYAQQSIKPRGRLTCKYVWYRKWPYVFHGRPGEKRLDSVVKRMANSFLVILFFLSFRMLGRRAGWVGLFTKL